MFSELLRLWRQVTLHPSVASFESAAAGVSFDGMVIGAALAAMAAGVGNFLNQLAVFILRATVDLTQIDPATAELLRSLSGWEAGPTALMGRAFINFVMLPPAYLVGFFVAAWLSWRLARAAGGPGDFTLHGYLLSLALAPLTLLGSLLGVIPVLGPLAAAALALYSFIPATSAVRAAHGFAGGRAWLALGVWLLAVLVVALIATALAVAVLTLLIAMTASRR